MEFLVKSMEQAGKIARGKVQSLQTDQVLAADDNAQECFSKGYAGKARSEIVFLGVNTDPGGQDHPAVNITGILERLFLCRRGSISVKLPRSLTGLRRRTTANRVWNLFD